MSCVVSILAVVLRYGKTAGIVAIYLTVKVHRYRIIVIHRVEIHMKLRYQEYETANLAIPYY